MTSRDARLLSLSTAVYLALSENFNLCPLNDKVMGKRKLRGCAGCGGRHGPPTGKKCTHAEEIKRKEVAAAAAGPKQEAAAMLADSDEEAAQASGPVCGAEGHETDEDLLDLTLSTDDCALPGATEDFGRPSSPAGSGAMGARFLRQQMSAMQRERQDFEKTY